MAVSKDLLVRDRTNRFRKLIDAWADRNKILLRFSHIYFKEKVYPSHNFIQKKCWEFGNQHFKPPPFNILEFKCLKKTSWHFPHTTVFPYLQAPD